MHLKGWGYSFLVASYCIGQFFGSPLLGALSDRLGRKKILIFTLLLALIGYLLGALSICILSFFGLLLSRILAGVAAGNFAIAQSYIADGTEEASRSQNFGLLGMAWGSGFVLGPFIGGRCVDSSICFLFSWATPFYIAGFLCALNIVLSIFFLKESAFIPRHTKISLTRGLIDVKKAFSHQRLKNLFKVMFIFSFGWGFFTEFSPVFLMARLGLKVDEISNFFAWVGLWIALCQGILIRPIIKRFSSSSVLTGSLLAFSLVLLCVLFVKNSFQLFAIVPLLAFVESLIYPSAASIISSLTPQDRQGEVLGIYNSVQWAAIGLTPLLSGALIMRFPLTPVLVASICMMLAFGIFSLFRLKGKENISEDVL
jgi:DHA1 family tetracycline resistance protein-like MFS transporter